MKTERFEMRLDEETLAMIDAWREDQPSLPSRAEAIRRLVEIGHARARRESVTFSDGEKLLLLMMRDVYKHLGMTEAETDPDFIAEVIFGGHFWAPKWRLTGVFHDHEDNPADLHFVVDVLDMWNFIERGYEALSDADKALLEKEAAPFGKNVRFLGFDGNNEAELMSIARFLTRDMDRFTRFADRDLNAHMPTVETYRRMLPVFLRMRRDLVGAELSASQLAKLLNAKRHPDHAT